MTLREDGTDDVVAGETIGVSIVTLGEGIAPQ
jgi:hypothetical protein